MAASTFRLASLPLALFALGVVSGCDQGEVVGPDGGVVVSEDGRLVLEVPAGALSNEVAISIHAVDEGPEGTVRAYAVEPVRTQFSLPATVEYTWAVDATMTDPLLVIERGDEWRTMPDRHVDADDKLVVASTHYLGVVAVVAQ